MKKALLVVVLALALTFAFSSGAVATTFKGFTASTNYYKWSVGSTPADTWTGTARVYRNGSIPGTSTAARLPYRLMEVGDNPDYPGAHANYVATTAKCGMCHSVHRATGDGEKLLPTSDPTCSGCHVGGTAITAKVITWKDVDLDWVPSYDASGTLTNAAAAGGGGGPHNDPVWDTVLEEGATEYPLPSYELEPFSRYGCFTRRCHATNPHGANSSKYKIFAAKLLFNDSPADDDATNPDLVALHGNGTYGGDDAVWDDFGATDAAVERFVAANSSIMSTTAAGDVLINGELPDANETHALVAGLTCGRPSNAPTGEDECHAEAAYAIVDKGIKEDRNYGTGALSPNAIRTDNTGGEALGFGGNDNRVSKTGHVAGSFEATSAHASYAPIAGCTSCHDQTDSANTVVGNFTFPHGQTATGNTNLYRTTGAMATGLRVRIWAGWAGSTEDTLTTYFDSASSDGSYANQKAFDGQCLKCHRDGAGNGIGLTH